MILASSDKPPQSRVVPAMPSANEAKYAALGLQMHRVRVAFFLALCLTVYTTFVFTSLTHSPFTWCLVIFPPVFFTIALVFVGPFLGLTGWFLCRSLASDARSLRVLRAGVAIELLALASMAGFLVTWLRLPPQPRFAGPILFVSLDEPGTRFTRSIFALSREELVARCAGPLLLVLGMVSVILFLFFLKRTAARLSETAQKGGASLFQPFSLWVTGLIACGTFSEFSTLPNSARLLLGVFLAIVLLIAAVRFHHQLRNVLARVRGEILGEIGSLHKSTHRNIA